MLSDIYHLIVPYMLISQHLMKAYICCPFQGYYKRTAEYKPILDRHVTGVHEVPMIHSTLLLDLKDETTKKLAYDPPPPAYDGPKDDIIIFSHSAKHHEVPLHVMNKDFYGYLMVPMEAHNSLPEEEQQFNHMRAESIGRPQVSVCVTDTYLP